MKQNKANLNLAFLVFTVLGIMFNYGYIVPQNQALGVPMIILGVFASFLRFRSMP